MLRGKKKGKEEKRGEKRQKRGKEGIKGDKRGKTEKWRRDRRVENKRSKEKVSRGVEISER